MSKGVIVQLDYNVAHVLKNDGTFETCSRNDMWQVGDVIEFHSRPHFRKRIYMLCFLFICLLGGVGSGVYMMPSSYIEISVNPSVQMTLNILGRVINIKGLNEDGDNLIKGISYNNLTLQEAYARLFNRLDNSGYLTGATVQIVIANNSQKTVDNIEQTIRLVSEKYVKTNNTQIILKRYANEEYLMLTHPLPIMEITDNQNKNEIDWQTEAPSDNEVSPPTDDEAARHFSHGNTEKMPPGGMRHHGNGNWRNGQ